MGKLKTFIKNTIYNSKLLPIKNRILLESSPDYSDNTKFFYDELLNQKINDSYKIYWIVSNKNKFDDINVKNVKFINRNSLKFKYLNLTSKVIVDCNQFIPKYNKRQLRIHLTHGSALKVVTKYYEDVGLYDYITVTSDFNKEIFHKEFDIDLDKIVVTGYPRDDYAYKDTYFSLFDEVKRKKTIIWMPTYRNHKNANAYQTGLNYIYGIPCISSEDGIITLNKKLKDLEILLIIKLHPAENTSKIKTLDLSNIKILDNEMVSKDHHNIYDYLNGFDALITDYSSIYYDYMLTLKKIGLAIPDLKEFSESFKMAFSNYEDNIKGFYIRNFKDILDFIDYVNSNDDPIRNDLKKIIPKHHKYQDGNSSKRVVELMLNHLRGE